MSEHPFKVGDWVRCVDDYSGIRVGRKYQIVGVMHGDPPMMRVLNDQGFHFGYLSSRFERCDPPLESVLGGNSPSKITTPEQPAFKCGQRIRCVNAIGEENLTKNRMYVVGLMWAGKVNVMSNTNRPQWFASDRFVDPSVPGNVSAMTFVGDEDAW